ncbi:MAG: precorrin-6y C5,15-methyltransferase (decarboxylating), CbiE subunit [Peptococcaceae bacterium]|jgi:precorrin-6y C5,15-methyltransferase (decarboxylating) CbiE subunit|nr:precorrin-6y C5,15-methyltransferase (decarboxylating), CbiE subunit [Peptococcaceae bacterium]
MNSRLHVVGTGSGYPDYTLPLGLKIIKKCQVLVGGQRFIHNFAEAHHEIFYVKNNLPDVVAYLKSIYKEKETCVLVSGDPGFYSFLGYLRQHFAAGELNVIPGISSISLAFAKLAESWHDARLISLHGRSLDALSSLTPGQKIAILTDNKNTPSLVAQKLSTVLGNDCRVTVCEALGTPQERLTTTTLDKVYDSDSVSLLVISHV